MGNKTSEAKEAAPTAPQVKTEVREQSEKEIRYVVVRDGHRVSPNEYSYPEDPKALDEVAFWSLVENRHSWRAPTEIVKYDNRLHRVFSVA